MSDASDNARSPREPPTVQTVTISGPLAKAFYDARVKRARETVEKIDFPASRVQETLIEVRDCGDDRAAVITLFALLEDSLILLMKRNMNKSVRGGLERLFSHHGLLGTASNRISMCAALGWIGPDLHSELDLVRKMRNEFAHKVDIRSLSDTPVRSWLAAMRPEETRCYIVGQNEVKRDPSLIVREIKDYTPRYLLVVRGAALIRDLCVQLSSNPIAQAHNVNPDHIFGEYDDMPEAGRALMMAISYAIYGIIIEKYHE